MRDLGYAARFAGVVAGSAAVAAGSGYVWGQLTEAAPDGAISIPISGKAIAFTLFGGAGTLVTGLGMLALAGSGFRPTRPLAIAGGFAAAAAVGGAWAGAHQLGANKIKRLRED